MKAKRLNRLTDLLGQSLAGLLISIAAVLVIDGIYALLGLGEFGQISGWLALVFPVLIFVQQFSAAKGEKGRIVVAAGGAVAAVALGMAAAGTFSHLPPIGSGAIGALVATLVYVTVWHLGLSLSARKG